MAVDGFGFVFGTFALIWLAALVLVIWALVDCLQVKEDSSYQSGTKLVWVLIIIFLWGLGAIIYLAIGRPKPGSSGAAPSAGGPPGTPGPVPPPPPGSLD
ncbi:MAG: PLD nuclease N-terminal domain-containing protein [Actinomycetota bacterium]